MGNCEDSPRDDSRGFHHIGSKHSERIGDEIVTENLDGYVSISEAVRLCPGVTATLLYKRISRGKLTYKRVDLPTESHPVWGKLHGRPRVMVLLVEVEALKAYDRGS